MQTSALGDSPHASISFNPKQEKATASQDAKSLRNRNGKPKPRHAVSVSRRHSHSFPKQNKPIPQNRGENKAVHPHKTYFESINHLYAKQKTKWKGGKNRAKIKTRNVH
jgi:hypothetical protein